MSAVLIILWGAGLVALMDAIRRPVWQWVEADRNKGAWVGMLGVGVIFGPLGLAFTIAYAVGVLPGLTRASTVSNEYLK